MSDDTIEKLALLALGWLLGMLGPVVTDAIKRRRENLQVIVALAAELRELSYQLALANYVVHMHFGTVTRDYLAWLQGVTRHYTGPSRLETTQPSLAMQLELTDEQLTGAVQRMKANEGTTLVLRKFAVPLLDARVSSLWAFDNRVQVLLLDIRSNIALLNELVDQSRYYSGLTFGKLEAGNYELAVGNLRGSQRQYADRAKILVSKIAELQAADTKFA